MRIGRLSRRSGLSRDTIRFYERNGLIQSTPSAEGSNNYRNYSEETLQRLHTIVEARDAGFSIGDLQQLFAHIEGDGEPFEADRFLDSKIAEVTHLIERSKRLLAMLKGAKAAIRGPNRA